MTEHVHDENCRDLAERISEFVAMMLRLARSCLTAARTFRRAPPQSVWKDTTEGNREATSGHPKRLGFSNIAGEY